ALPDDDDILEEVLLRLPPRPSSLPRDSLVCKRWLRILSDPRFLRRFRAFHCRSPQLLGLFFEDLDDVPRFIPTLDPPDRIPSARFSHAPLPGRESWNFLGCRHGLALLLNRTRLEVTVWDPITGDQLYVAAPPEMLNSEGAEFVRHGAVLCEDGRVPLEAFKVVLLADGCRRHHVDAQVFASLYESETSVWSSLTSTSIRAPLSDQPSILVGNSLYWLLLGYVDGGILEFNLDRKSLAVIEHPVGAHVAVCPSLQILRMEASGLGLASLSGANIQLWERKADSGCVARWMLHKIIDLGKLLSLRSPMETWHVIVGYDEDGHAIFISSRAHQVSMVQLKSMQFRNLFESKLITAYHPFTSFYATGNRSSLLFIQE
ncbi:uncharacterized protein LOC120639887, partial [Panicum virgatum]|uniref:uncharacterized protein LOC120639887 n=1 Tax=Panicum virgatum TaxID=38727 RepID=UPI0019D5FF17